MIKHRLFATIAIVVFTLITVVPVLAHGTPPNEDPNWCAEEDHWGNGKCVSNDHEIEHYMWLAGWCGAMLEAGRIEFDNIEDCLSFFSGDDGEEDTVDVNDTSDDDDGDPGDTDE